MKKLTFVFAILLCSCGPMFGDSKFTERPDDRSAVYVTAGKFPVHGDGIADDTDGLQQAIDLVQETTNQGIVFLPARRYENYILHQSGFRSGGRP
jgi:hypothetical protein